MIKLIATINHLLIYIYIVTGQYSLIYIICTASNPLLFRNTTTVYQKKNQQEWCKDDTYSETSKQKNEFSPCTETQVTTRFVALRSRLSPSYPTPLPPALCANDTVSKSATVSIYPLCCTWLLVNQHTLVWLSRDQWYRRYKIYKDSVTSYEFSLWLWPWKQQSNFLHKTLQLMMMHPPSN